MDLEEDIMALKERIMQERNDARKEKARLEGEIVSYLSIQDFPLTRSFTSPGHDYQTIRTTRSCEPSPENVGLSD